MPSHAAFPTPRTASQSSWHCVFPPNPRPHTSRRMRIPEHSPAATGGPSAFRALLHRCSGMCRPPTAVSGGVGLEHPPAPRSPHFPPRSPPSLTRNHPGVRVLVKCVAAGVAAGLASGCMQTFARKPHSQHPLTLPSAKGTALAPRGRRSGAQLPPNSSRPLIGPLLQPFSGLLVSISAACAFVFSSTFC